MMSLEEYVGRAVENNPTVLVFSPKRPPALDDSKVLTVSDVGGDIELPIEFETFEDRIKFGIEGAIENELVHEGETVLCIDNVFGRKVDTFSRIEITDNWETGLYNLFMNSKAEPKVIKSVVELAIELGKKGQKGEPIGALFVVGDAGKVMDRSRELSYNPFEKSHVHVGDPIVNVMLKEFSRLDGAFVISDSGKIVSAYRYLEAEARGVDIPKGLGTRHMAAASITQDTNSVSVVLSESDNLVRVFKRGEVVLEIDPENY
ncbi:MAG: diadenylate cyclase domain-containing protein [Halobacteria archaeon]